MVRGMVAATTFNIPHQTHWPQLTEDLGGRLMGQVLVY